MSESSRVPSISLTLAEPIREEQLGDRQEAVVRRRVEHCAGVRVGRGLQAAVPVHHTFR